MPSWSRIIEWTDLFKRAFIVLIVLALAEHGGVLAIVERPLDETFHLRSVRKYMQYRSVIQKSSLQTACIWLFASVVVSAVTNATI